MTASEQDPLRRSIQAALGETYVVERELGGGGMSHVFVARDETLGRSIVVKVLPPDAVAASAASRFEREIALAARLQHPNIVPLLSAGATTDGVPFYTMPFVAGESLRARLDRTGELPLGEAITILRDVLRALAYAHAQGVVHRDIKPDNVLLSGGAAVVTDFGVAKAVSALGGGVGSHPGTLVTQIGVALGTPAYMSPEQASADPAIDQRADIYALGCLAYELLTGSSPFAGRLAQAMLAAHVTEVPTPIAQRRPSVPPALAAVVMQCLEKRPGDRPQRAEDVLRVIDAIPVSGDARIGNAPTAPRRRIGAIGAIVAIAAISAISAIAIGTVVWRQRTASAGRQISSLAVIPFESTDRDTASSYLEDAVSDPVRDALKAVSGLVVKARSSSRRVKGRQPREIGSLLGVDAVLQGTVSRSASRLHVTAELVRASDESVVWSGTFSGDSGGLAAIQDSIARVVGANVGTHSGGANPAARAIGDGYRGTRDVDAYYAFLRGRHAADRLDWLGAIRFYKEAVRRDPRFARAYGDLAMAYTNAPTLGTVPVDSMTALAEESARRALDLDSTVAEAYVARAFALVADLRLDAALPYLEKALSVDSANSDVLGAYGITLAQVGRINDGLRFSRRAYALDPLSSTAIGIQAYLLQLAGQDDSAIALTRAGLVIDPANPLMAHGLGVMYAYHDQRDSAIKSFEYAYRVGPRLFFGRNNLVVARALAGRWSDAERERATLERDAGNSPNFLRALDYLAFDERDSAMVALGRSVAAREALAGVLSLPCDPRFDPLKADTRFVALMREVGARDICPATHASPFPRRPH